MSVAHTLSSLGYLLGVYWPYLAGALVVGVGAGWFSAAGPKG
jgi:hypothetical protein